MSTDDEQKWIQIAVPGSFRKLVNGEIVAFTLDAKVFREVVANFNAKPSQSRMIRWDLEHTSEPGRAPDSVALTGVPAVGWIYDLRYDAKGLYALTEFIEPAKTYVKEKKYRFCSPALRLNPLDSQGQRNGAVLSSCALTNDPFLSQLPPIAATNGGGDGLMLVYGEGVSLLGETVQLSRVPAVPPAPVAPVRTYEQRLAGMALLLMKSGERYVDAMREARTIVPLSATDSTNGNEETIMSKSVRADVEAAYETLYPRPTYDTCGGGKPNPKEYVANHDLGSYAAALAKWERDVLAPLVAQWVKARDIEVDRVLGGNQAREANERSAATGGRAGELTADDEEAFLLTGDFTHHVNVIQKREKCSRDRAFNLAYRARKNAEDSANISVQLKAGFERTGDAADCFTLSVPDHVNAVQVKHQCSRNEAYNIVCRLRHIHGSSERAETGLGFVLKGFNDQGFRPL